MLEIPGYKIEKQLGKGGMARVYLALHEGLDRHVAIKVMSKNLDDEDDNSFSERFISEARIVAKLNHVNIITVFDVGVHDGHHYIAMELVPGENLDDKIKKDLGEREALIVMKQIASALDFAHSKHIIHRDIKPENILFREDGTAILADFGIAKATESTAKMTATGTVIGTPHYMSPEQAQGQEVGSYSDFYSLGVVFYEMLTGRVPYDADATIAIVFKHITESVPSLDAAHARFQPLLDTLLAKDHKDRYHSGREIITDIECLERGETAANATAIFSSTEINPAIIAAATRNNSVVPPQAAPENKKGNGKLYLGLSLASILMASASGGAYFYITEEKTTTDKKAQEQARLDAKTRKGAENLAPQKNTQRQKELADKKVREDERLALLQKKKRGQALARKQEINNMLSKAETAYDKNNLRNAYDYYQQVLAIDKGNRSAKEGITSIAGKYLTFANKAAKNNDFDKANRHVTSAINVSPTHPQLSSTQKNIFSLRGQHLQKQAAEQQASQPKITEEKAEPTEQEVKKKRRSFGGF